MEIRTWPMRYILTTALAVLAVVIIVAAASRKRVEPRPSKILSTQQEDQRVQASMPPVISSAKDLEIVTAYVDSEKQANIVIFNKSRKGIQGFAVSSGSFTLIEDDGLETDNPKTIIAPYASYTIQLPASNLRTTLPVVISAVIYDDHTEDGDSAVRKKVHDARHKEKEKRLLHLDDR
jgi:hypothetical protein